LTIADKPSNIRIVDWSVSGFYDIAVALEDKDHRLLIGSLHGFVFFVMMCVVRVVRKITTNHKIHCLRTYLSTMTKINLLFEPY